MTEELRPSVVSVGRSQRRLRNYLLVPRFQLKYTIALVGVAAVLLVALGAMVARTSAVAVAQARDAVDLASLAEDQSERALRESQSSARILRMQQLAAAPDDPAVVRTIERELEEVERRYRADLARVQRQRAKVRSQRELIAWSRARTLQVLVVAGVSMLLALTILGVMVTHRIVGPVHRMKRLFTEVGQGTLRLQGKLRRGDELTDLYDAFEAMILALRTIQARELSELDAAIALAEKGGADPETLAALRALRGRMDAHLGGPSTGERSTIA
ncbi:MAG: HAMP domain-containing protein [Deltaproteobacteria bacterium]|nr:HAMP domain-containing protein [Deltaproteobacteria bacterium]